MKFDDGKKILKKKKIIWVRRGSTSRNTFVIINFIFIRALKMFIFQIITNINNK